LRRLGSIVALIAFVVGTAIITMLVLAYGIEPRLPEDVRVAEMETEATITWDDELSIIEADDEAALYTALGFSHGLQRSWTATLWRQAALAGLASWFGSELAEVDSLALQLGLASGAREAFRSLSSDDQALLRSYARGMNHALARRSVRLQDEFAVLRVQPERWEPWHALAVERLFSWLATEGIADTLHRRNLEELAVAQERSARLRDFLAAGNYHHSAAWIATVNGERRLFSRYVHGASTEPYLYEQVFVLGGDTLLVASLPGAPIFPAGSSRDHAWAILPTSASSLALSASDTLQLPVVHDRIVDRAGNEYLVSFRRSSEGLEIGQGLVQVPGDTVGSFIDRRVSYRITWPGFAPVSDVHAWRALLRGQRQSFRLVDGTGIILTSGGADLLGPNNAAFATSGAVIAAGAPRWIGSIAETIARRATEDGDDAPSIFDDTFSAWAESTAPAMIAAARSIPEPPRPVRDALTYLRNWDFRYDEASIAATVFDVWVGRYTSESGLVPTAAAADTFFAERFLRYRTLAETVDELTERFGDSMSQWRWENVMEDERYASGWPPPERFSEAPRNRRFTTVSLPGHGHPSSPAYGPSPLDGFGRGAAVWEGVAAPGPRLEVRRRVVNMRSFLGRYMVSDRPPSFKSVGAIESGRRTRLHP
jgi:penicillin G amidase